MKTRRHHKMHRYSNDLEKMRRADAHCKEALEYLRKCENPDRVIPLIAGIRRLRTQLELIFENALPKFPGEERKPETRLRA